MKVSFSSVLLSTVLSLGLSLGTSSSFADLPKNNLHLQDNINRIENIDEKLFNEIIDQAAAIYAPIIAKHGAQLQMVKRWSDSTVNAYASQSGKIWKVEMFGGLARRPEVTPDGFAMVVCHELGHHLGGYTFYGDTDWASTEGNSDYFATQACSKMLWAKQARKNREIGRFAPRRAQAACDQAWQNQIDRDHCYRTAAAGLSLANLLAAIGDKKTPKFETPDPTVVKTTKTGHPNSQCRLDTYFHGALCSMKFDPSVIPGKNHAKGQNSPQAEAEAAKYSCMQAAGANYGYRPLCWFKPLVRRGGFEPSFELN